MANKKISELTIVTELDGAETLPIVQGTETKKVSIAQIVTKVDSYTKSESDTLLGEKVSKIGADDIEVTLATKGVILKSPNGTRYRITVNDDGSLQTAGGKHTQESDFKTVGGQSIVGTGDIALNASGETLNINNNIKKAVLLHEILYHE